MKRHSIIATLAAIFLLATICSGQEMRSGDPVWAQWRPNDWYHGKVSGPTALGYLVAFDDGDRAELPAVLIVADIPPRSDAVAVGTRVLAPWTGGKLFPGTVMALPHPGSAQIQFDDGDRTVVPLDLLRLRPKPQTRTFDLQDGDIVWAQWKPNSWYHGRITGPGNLGFKITFDDGDKADLPPALIVADRPPQHGQVKIGARVLARWTNDRLYPGTVTAEQQGGGCTVRFDDGAILTLPAHDLRVLGE